MTRTGHVYRAPRIMQERRQIVGMPSRFIRPKRRKLFITSDDKWATSYQTKKSWKEHGRKARQFMRHLKEEK